MLHALFRIPFGTPDGLLWGILFADQKLNFAPTNQLRGSDGP